MSSDMFNRVYDKKRKALIDLLLTQSTRSGVTMAIVTTLIGMVVWSSYPTELVISWVSIGYFVNLSRNFIFKTIQKWVMPESSYLWLEFALVIQLSLSGVFWGVTCWIFLNPQDMATFVFVALAVAAVAPSALPVFSALPYIWFLYASLVLVLMAAKLYSVGFWELSILAIINLIGLTPLSKNLGKTIEKSITLDIENSELLGEVREAKEKAEKANLAKSQFLAAASHDLRQPLHAQGILLEALGLRLQQKDQCDLLRKVTQSNDVLNSLFNALLEISQLDAGTIKINVSHQPILEICQTLLDEYQLIAQENGLYLELSGEDCIALTDPILLNRILRNLVSNAIKFTAAGGVKIHIKSAANEISISVSDTGVGIPMSQRQHVFDEYYQLDNKARDRNKGIGLGLALVRRMCDLLQHNIRLDSEVGKGSSFTLELPFGEASKVVTHGDDLSAGSIEGLCILVIDDEQPILDAMAVMLSDWKCHPKLCISLQAAEEMLKEKNYQPDLIISDYRLKGGVTGLDAIRSLRRRISENVPALIISGDTDPELLESIHRQKFYILHKPVKSTQLKKVIRILVENKDQ